MLDFSDGAFEIRTQKLSGINIPSIVRINVPSVVRINIPTKVSLDGIHISAMVARFLQQRFRDSNSEDQWD